MKNCLELFFQFARFCVEMRNQINASIYTLRSDNAKKEPILILKKLYFTMTYWVQKEIEELLRMRKGPFKE